MPTTTTGVSITERQLRVGMLAATGHSTEEIGAIMYISGRTAKAYCDILRDKLGVTKKRRIGAALVAHGVCTADEIFAEAPE
jgi:DNA-binding CsgD family transcriptional regulator